MYKLCHHLDQCHLIAFSRSTLFGLVTDVPIGASPADKDWGLANISLELNPSILYVDGLTVVVSMPAKLNADTCQLNIPLVCESLTLIRKELVPLVLWLVCVSEDGFVWLESTLSVGKALYF